jgi:hypothetical protein
MIEMASEDSGYLGRVTSVAARIKWAEDLARFETALEAQNPGKAGRSSRRSVCQASSCSFLWI